MVSKRRLELILHGVSLYQAFLHLFSQLVEACFLPLIDTLVGGLHLSRPKFSNRLLALEPSIVKSIFDILNVGFLSQLCSDLNSP